MSDSVRPHKRQPTRPHRPCDSPGKNSGVCCHPIISPSIIPFSSCLQSFPASGSFPMSWLFASGGQSIRALDSASASVLPMNQSASSVSQSCLTLCDPMDCSRLGFPVHHQLPESTQTNAHQVGDAIQPSHTLSSPFPPAFNLSQHRGLSQ